MLVAVGLMLYTVSTLAPAFVSSSLAPRTPSSGLLHQGTADTASRPAGNLGSSSGSAALLAVAVGAATGIAASLKRASARSSCIQRRADGSGLDPGGPVKVYCEALVEAAKSKNESVQVTKDMMKLKIAFKEDDDFLDGMLAQNTPSNSQVDNAQLVVDLLQPLESTVLPKFLTFLGKKRRLCSLNKIAEQYIQTLYINASIAPVKVIGATMLTDAQKTAIKDKMKKKLDVDDINLTCEVDVGLIGGFKIQYGYTDPDRLRIPTQEIDISLKRSLEVAAVKEGVAA